MRFLRRFAALLSLAVLAVPILYALAVLGLGLLPAPYRDPLSDQPKVPVYLLSNGWHVWLALPVHQEGTDWNDWLAADRGPAISDVAGRIENRDYVAFGWGDRDFYLNTRRPVDFRPGLAAAALLGRGPATMHVMRIDQPDIESPQARHRVRRLEVDSEQYHALATYIRNGFSAGPNGRPRQIPEAGFGSEDAFYEANGHYSPFRTCNEWIGAGLRAAGLPTGRWTPLPFGLMRSQS